MRVVAALVAASFLYGLWIMASDYFMYRDGQRLEREIDSEQLTDLDQIWTRWTELSKANPSALLLHAPRRAVKQKFVASADHVIDMPQGLTARCSLRSLRTVRQATQQAANRSTR